MILSLDFYERIFLTLNSWIPRTLVLLTVICAANPGYCTIPRSEAFLCGNSKWPLSAGGSFLNKGKQRRRGKIFKLAPAASRGLSGLSHVIPPMSQQWNLYVMFIEQIQSWVARHKGLDDSSLCLTSCCPVCPVCPVSLLPFVRLIRMYRARIEAVRVRLDIAIQRYIQMLPTVR